MKSFKIVKPTTLTALPLVLVLLLSTNAEASIGTVLTAIGPVTVEKPEIEKLSRRQRVDEGDVIVTGPRGYVQLKLDDGTKISIRPKSRFIIDAFEAPATATSPAIGAGTSLKARFSLKKGGFRTITGRISKRDPSSYLVTTPAAVIGVRGTHYLLQICSADCGDGIQGLVGTVLEGEISVENDAGGSVFGTDQFFNVPSANDAPRTMMNPPAALVSGAMVTEESDEGDDDGGGDSGGDADGGTEEGTDEGTDEGDTSGSDNGDSGDSGDSADSADSGDSSGSEESESLATEFTTPDATSSGTDQASTAAGETSTTTTTVEPVDQIIEAESDTGIPVDITDGTVSVINQPLAFTFPGLVESRNTASETVAIDDAGSLTNFQVLNNDLEVVTYGIGTASNVNRGTDPETSLKWGRWSEGVADVSTLTNQSPLDLNQSSLHWIIAPIEDLPIQEITGSASYVLVGNTDPTDNLGNVGILGSASFSANFTSSSVTSNIQLGINNQVWNATGTGEISAQLFSGLYSTVTVGGVSGGSGAFAGVFSGFDGANAPQGAGMTYDLSNGSTIVNGVVVFNRSTGE